MSSAEQRLFESAEGDGNRIRVLTVVRKRTKGAQIELLRCKGKDLVFFSFSNTNMLRFKLPDLETLKYLNDQLLNFKFAKLERCFQLVIQTSEMKEQKKKKNWIKLELLCLCLMDHNPDKL